jgi:hypothetical protein
MPALPVIPNVFRVALNWTGAGGQIAVNVIHVLDNTAAATTDDIEDALDTAAGGSLWAPVVPSASVTDIAVTPLDGVHATDHFAPGTPSHWVGQNGTDFVPQVAVILKLSTGLRGRSHRGRVFLPFIEEGGIQNGLLDSTTAANMTTSWSSFKTSLPTGTPSLEWVVASYKLGTAPVVTNVVCETVLATQRRRQGRLRGA